MGFLLNERWKCQISDSDRFERPARANFIENKEFSYRGIKVFGMHFKRFWLPPRNRELMQRAYANEISQIVARAKSAS